MHKTPTANNQGEARQQHLISYQASPLIANDRLTPHAYGIFIKQQRGLDYQSS